MKIMLSRVGFNELLGFYDSRINALNPACLKSLSFVSASTIPRSRITINDMQSVMPHDLSLCVRYNSNALWNSAPFKWTISTSSDVRKSSITSDAYSLKLLAKALPTSRSTASVVING